MITALQYVAHRPRRGAPRVTIAGGEGLHGLPRRARPRGVVPVRRLHTRVPRAAGNPLGLHGFRPVGPRPEPAGVGRPAGAGGQVPRRDPGQAQGTPRSGQSRGADAGYCRFGFTDSKLGVRSQPRRSRNASQERVNDGSDKTHRSSNHSHRLVHRHDRCASCIGKSSLQRHRRVLLSQLHRSAQCGRGQHSEGQPALLPGAGPRQRRPRLRVV